MENTVKQFDHLLRAYALSEKKVPLVICGDGSLINNYKDLANELHISKNVHFIGFQSNPYAYMHLAKFTVLCSAFEGLDRKSTRLNSSHLKISYAVFCLKKKTEI